ncbi:MAG: phosphoribosylglycinamide formyltransferase [Ahniella sp.]|nr:phosphoribosylglycinamide formyltransferase [Ahniella sp.]
MATFRLAVLASGRGSNLKALLDAIQAGTLPAEVVGVFGDKQSAGALEIARSAGIPAHCFSPRSFPDRTSFDRALFAAVDACAPDLIVLAGFMRILSPDVVAARPGRLINIHPSLLPKYPGLHTHQRALEAGDTEHGATVHWVTADLDAGPVIAQARLAIGPADTAETLAARLLPLEHELLVRVVSTIASRTDRC